MPREFNPDNMLNNFFGKIDKAFRKVDAGVETLDAKMSKISASARTTFSAFTSSVNKSTSAVEKMNNALEKQNRLIRNMPKVSPAAPSMPRGPQPIGQPPRAPEGRSPRGGGGGRFRFGGTSAGNFYAGGFGGLGGLGTLGAAYGIGTIGRGFGEFDSNIHTLMAEAGPDMKSVGGQEGLTQNILDISGSTQFSSGETAELLIQMVKDGVKLKDALSEVPNVLKLAVAESTDLQTAWNTTNTIVSGLNVPLSDSVRLMDMMSNATSLSKLKLENIQYIAGQSLSLYKEIAGFSEEGFLGISGILGPLFRPERIGTGLKQLSLLLPQAGRGELAGSKNDTFESWGVNITDAAGNLKDEVSVLKEFERVMGSMSGEQRNVELAKVFGTEAAPVFSALIGQSAKLAENMQAIRKAGTLDEKFAVHSESLTNQWKLLTSAGDSLIKKFVMILNEGNAFGTGIGWVTQQVTNLTHWMQRNKKGIQDWWGGLQKAIGVAWKYRDVIAAVVVGVTAFKVFNTAKTAVLGLKFAFDALMANPWGLAIAGIVAGAYLIYKNWEPIKAFFGKVFDVISKVVGWTWNRIKGFGSGIWDAITSPVQAVVGFVQENWGLLKTIFSFTPYGLILKAFSPVINFFQEKLREPITGFLEFVKSTFDAFVDTIKDKFDWLKGAVTDLLNWLPGVNIGDDTQPSMAKNAPKMKPVSEEMRGLTPAQVVQKRKTDAAFQKVLPVVVKSLNNVFLGKAPVVGKKETHYESRAAKPVTADDKKPKWGFDKFLEGVEKDNKEKQKDRDAFRKSFGIKTPEMRGAVPSTQKLENMYKIDDRAMSNVREHFEETAEKEFFSGLETYAEQSFAHINSTLTEAQRSMREKVFETQKFLKEDAKKWKEIMESGAGDKLSASVTAAGASASSQEAYDAFMGHRNPVYTAGLDATKRQEKYTKGFESLKGSIPDEMYNALKDNFALLVEKAPYSPLVKKLAGMIDLTETNKQAIEVAGLKRGHELLTEVTRTSDTVTQAERRYTEEDAGHLRNAYEYLKQHAPQLPQIQSLMARESMLTGEPQGTKMNVFEFPTLTKEQHVELTSVFRSHFLSLIDVNSAQLAVLQSIAGLLGVQNVAGTLDSGNFANVSETGPGQVIRQQHGTLSDDYLSHRHSQIRKQVFENINDKIPQGPPAQQISEVGPQIADVAAPQVSPVIPQLSDIQVQKQVFGPQIDIQSPNLNVPAVGPQIAGGAAPHVPVIQPKFEDAAAPHVPVIEPQFDPRFDNLVENVRSQSPTPQSESGEVTATESRGRTGESRIVIENPQITIIGADKDAKELAEEMWEELKNIMREEARENNF